MTNKFGGAPTAPVPGGEDASTALSALRLIAEGAYGRVPPGDGPLSQGVAGLAGKLATESRGNLRGLVTVSVQCGEAMFAIAEMARDVREVNNRAQAISAAAEEMVASVNEIAHASESAADDANQVQATATKGMQAADKAVSAMHHITRAVEDAAAKVDSLAEASAQIGEIVASIEAIAKQTNLLALNATIEAARAGEAGKGFAVVASEVKNLANQTAKATDDIRSRIEHLRGEMATIVESMQEGARAVEQGEQVILDTGKEMKSIVEQVSGVTEKMNEVATILSQQSEASNEVAEGVTMIARMADHNASAINDVVEAMDAANATVKERLDAYGALDLPFKVIDLAKADHVAFKRQIMDVAIGRKTVRADDLATHTSCRLGKWYYAVDDSRIRNDPLYRELERPHQAVHDHGKAALKLFAKGDMDRGLAEIAKLSEASHTVLDILDRLSRKLAG